MALVTVERSTPSPQELEEDVEVMSGSSGYEGFVATRSLVMFLPHRQWTHSNNKELLAIETHLKMLCKLSRPEDTVKLVIELEKVNSSSKSRYLVLLTTIGHQSKEECIILGTESDGEDLIKIGLVLPIWADTKVKLDGDGGFIVYTADRHHLFKPTSVQSMWSALQTLHKYSELARVNNFYVSGLSHTWVSWYTRTLTDNRSILNEWNLMEDIDIHRIDSPSFFALGKLGEEKDSVKKLLTHKLREIMLHENLEEVSVKQLKKKVEEAVAMDLTPYNKFLDQQMMVILKQMEKPSKIYDYLYLGSEWNAADLDELQDIGIGYILNITREIDNFYPGMFKYKNIRVFDVSTSDLLRHWDDTYKFIREAKLANSSVLVHCKMGISRSASTVIAFAMKEYNLTLKEAIQHVKSCRNVINPNPGFSKQLQTYEAILSARNNEVWGVQAPQRIIKTHRRSLSDPNIAPPTANRDSPVSCHQLDCAKKYAHSGSGGQGDLAAVHPMLTEEELRKSQLLEVDPQTTEQKVLSYLQSMEPYSDEEDQGISENSPESNSNSSLSSPICLTPPDEEYLDKWRDGKVIPQSLPPQKMSSELVGKVTVAAPSPIEKSGTVDVTDSRVEKESSLTPSRNSHFKPYGSSIAKFTSPSPPPPNEGEATKPIMTQSLSVPDNLANLGVKEEKESPAPRPVSVIGLASTHRRVHSEAITVMPSQKDWELLEEKKFGRSTSLVVTKQIDSVKERIKEMEQKHGHAPTSSHEHYEMKTSMSCTSLKVHSRKGSTLSSISSQESLRPSSQLSAHEKEDELAKKRLSGGNSPVNLSQVKEINEATNEEQPEDERGTPSPDNTEEHGAVKLTQIDTVRSIVQDIEQKNSNTTSTTILVRKRPLSESLSNILPQSSPTPIPRATTIHNSGQSTASPLSEEPVLTPPLKNRHHIRVRSYSSSPLTSPKMSPKLTRASPEANEVFDRTGIISSMACYSKEKLIRRRSLDMYQKHGDSQLATIPSVSQLKKLFENTTESPGTAKHKRSSSLQRSHSLRDLFISSNSVCRSSSLRSEGKPIFRKLSEIKLK